MSMKTLRALPIVVALAVAILAFSFANLGTAGAWLHPGPTYQYPSTGGTWKYGFWDVKVRSYYTVNRCHGSTVEYNGSRMRSADTAPGATSIAEKYAYNAWYNDDAYYYRVC